MLRLLSNVGTKVFTQLSSIRNSIPAAPSLTSRLLVPQPVISEQVRTVIKFSSSGKRKSVRPVIKRFFRLHWGAWIRTKAGRHRKMWSKTPVNRRQLREHVFCTATQSTLLDRMVSYGAIKVSEYWRRPKYYIEDPYTPYHTREQFWITRRKPWRPEGWE